MTVVEFGKLVRKMREAQNEYLKYQSSLYRKKAKTLEKEVDDILNNSYFAPNTKMPTPGNLFG